MSSHSKIRNKAIANIFSQMGLVEAWGSGIKRILNVAQEYGLSKPCFQEFDKIFRANFFHVRFGISKDQMKVINATSFMNFIR